MKAWLQGVQLSCLAVAPGRPLNLRGPPGKLRARGAVGKEEMPKNSPSTLASLASCFLMQLFQTIR